MDKLTEIRAIKARFNNIKFPNHDAKKLEQFAQICRDIAKNLIGENVMDQIKTARDIVEQMSSIHFSTERPQIKECRDLFDIINKIAGNMEHEELQAKNPETKFNKGTQRH